MVGKAQQQVRISRFGICQHQLFGQFFGLINLPAFECIQHSQAFGLQCVIVGLAE